MTVNAKVDGELRVRVVDEQGKPVQGFDWSAPIRGDAVAHRVAWKGTLASLRGRIVRLEFMLRQGELYGFDLNQSATLSPSVRLKADAKPLSSVSFREKDFQSRIGTSKTLPCPGASIEADIPGPSGDLLLAGGPGLHRTRQRFCSGAGRTRSNIHGL